MASASPRKSEDDTSLRHDAVVLLADKNLVSVFVALALTRRLSERALAVWDDANAEGAAALDALEFRIGCVLEWETPDTDEFRRYVDLAVTLDGAPAALLEIKSASEPQTASGWFRQIRGYEKQVGVPCTLVVAHDLADWMHAYLRRAGVSILDLRKVQ